MHTPSVTLPRTLKNLILIGYRGSGKSTLGRLIAARVNWSFVDTDERIAAGAGCDVRTLFVRAGETAFRDREQQIIADVCLGESQVIAVGGGAVLREANRAALKAAGACVWLTASVEELRKRLVADPAGIATRPALTPAGALEEIAAVLEQRTPLYQAVADYSISTDNLELPELVDRVISRAASAATSEGAR